MRDGGACNGDTDAGVKASSPRRRTVLLRLRRAPRPTRSRHKRPERRALPRRKVRQHIQPPPLRRFQSPLPPPPARPPPHDGSPPFHTPELPIGAPPAKHSQGAARTGPSPKRHRGLYSATTNTIPSIGTSPTMASRRSRFFGGKFQQQLPVLSTPKVRLRRARPQRARRQSIREGSPQRTVRALPGAYVHGRLPQR